MNNYKDTINKIKSRGYWKLIIEPVLDLERFFEHEIDGKRFVDNCKVSLRGWDYPHVPTTRGTEENYQISNGQVSSFTDWNHFKECWTYYQSGQFVHIFGLCEDWFSESDWLDKSHHLKQIKPLTLFDFVWSTYTITEMMLFVRNVAKDPHYGGNVKITISLHNTNNRKLTVLDPGRLSLFIDRESSSNDLIGLARIVSTKELDENYLTIARDTIINIIKFFDWSDPPIKVIEDDQQKLINRKL